MSGMKGRAVIIRRNNVNLAGVRTKSITINGSPVDITTDDDDGVRKLMDQPGQLDVAISVSGVMLNEQLISESLNTTDRVLQTHFLFAGLEGSPTNTFGFSGDFFLASLKFNAEYQGAVTFEADFQSAGPVAYTAK